MAQPVNAATEAASGGHGGGFPPFQTETFASQLLWFAIAFGALYWVMSRLALPRIAALLDNRAARISADLDDAQRLKTESEKAAEAYEAALAAARNNAKAIAQATRERLAAESDTRRKALEADLGKKLAAAEATIRGRTAEAMGNVRAIAADAAGAIVERLTGEAPDRASLDHALDRALPR